jgi:hypothetical protein
MLIKVMYYVCAMIVITQKYLALEMGLPVNPGGHCTH